MADNVDDQAGEGHARVEPTRTRRARPKVKVIPEAAVAEKAERTRKRNARPFPAASFEEALEFARELYQFGSGQPVRRLSLFDHLGKAPESGPSRMLITNANRYGLTRGSYSSEHLELTDEGRKAVDDTAPVREQRRAWSRLAVLDIEPFRLVYEKLQNARLPARAALIDAMTDAGVAPEATEEGVDTFVVNLRFVGLLQTLSGADRIVTVDHMLDGLPAGRPPAALGQEAPSVLAEQRSLVTKEQAGYATTCFYITPIGEDGSEERKHSDLFLGSIVEPAVQAFGLQVVRADAIDKPGMITRQIIEYILRSRLVIVDLSFHNPNVFYELALRHATRLPIVQVMRAGDRLPFDVHQMRTIIIDNRDIYALVPKIETYRAEIASQVRSALAAERELDTPISLYFPTFRVSFDGIG